MAIIKCDDVTDDQALELDDGGTETPIESYVEQDDVSIGKKLLAVESELFTENASEVPLTRDVQAPFLTENRPSGISDQFRAEFGKFWVQDINDKESAMVFLNRSLGNQQAHEDWEGIFAPTVFELEEKGLAVMSTPTDEPFIGLSQYTQAYVATALESYWGNITENLEASDIWTAYTQGIKAERGSFSRPTPLVPDGETFTDHAFQMNTPFSKKELEMFANISNAVSVADVESDYDFYSKAYEEGIASTTVPENALPHLYTEVQKGESETENIDKIEEGYFREWINTVLSNQDKMDEIAEDYENVAILDSVVSEDSILDSESKTTSAFEILMAYANRENLFPMNVNIEVDTNNASDLMLEAEDVGMVDDIVRFLIGDGNTVPADYISINPINPEISAESDESMQFFATLHSGGVPESIFPTWGISTGEYGTITSDGLFTPIDEESEEVNPTPHTVKVTAYYESMEGSIDFLIHPIYSPEPEDTKPGNRGAAPKIGGVFGTLIKIDGEDNIDEGTVESNTMGEKQV